MTAIWTGLNWRDIPLTITFWGALIRHTARMKTTDAALIWQREFALFVRRAWSDQFHWRSERSLASTTPAHRHKFGRIPLARDVSTHTDLHCIDNNCEMRLENYSKVNMLFMSLFYGIQLKNVRQSSNSCQLCSKASTSMDLISF